MSAEAFATHSPLLFVTSAEGRWQVDSARRRQLSGKAIAEASELAGRRCSVSIAKWQPTMIVDEADDAFDDNVGSAQCDQLARRVARA